MKKYLFVFLFIIISSALLAQTSEPTSHAATHLENEDEGFQIYDGFSGAPDPCNQVRALYKQAEDMIAQYEQDVQDYKSGQFCSDCRRSAHQIEREDHTDFIQHINQGAGHGRHQIKATQGMYDTLYQKFEAKFLPLKKEHDQNVYECTNGKVKLQQDKTTEINSFNAKYNQITASINELKQISDGSDAQTIESYNSQLAEIKTEFQTETNKGNNTNIQTLNQLIFSMTDISTQVKTSISNYTGNAAAKNTLMANTKSNTTLLARAGAKPGAIPQNNNVGAVATMPISANADPIQQAAQLQIAKINLTYSTTHHANSSTVAQQQYLVNTLQQQSNAQTIQAVGTLATGLLNIWSESQQRKEEEEEREEQQRQEKLAEQQRREEEQKEEEREEQQRNATINNNILGTHVNEQFTDLPRSGHLSVVYYLAWYRAYNGTKLYIFPTIEVKKYSDGTWPFFKDIKDKMRSKMSDAGVGGIDALLIGYYTREADMQSAANDLINNANAQQLVVEKLYLEDRKDNINNNTEQKTKTNKSFWDN